MVSDNGVESREWFVEWNEFVNVLDGLVESNHESVVIEESLIRVQIRTTQDTQLESSIKGIESFGELENGLKNLMDELPQTCNQWDALQEILRVKSTKECLPISSTLQNDFCAHLRNAESLIASLSSIQSDLESIQNVQEIINDLNDTNLMHQMKQVDLEKESIHTLSRIL